MTTRISLGWLMLVPVLATPVTAFDCSQPQSVTRKLAEAENLNVFKYSLDQLRCAAELAGAASREAPDDYAIAIKATGMTLDYMDLLVSLKKEDLMGVDKTFSTRITETTAKLTELTDRLDLLNSTDPAGKILRAAALAQMSEFSDAGQSVEMLRKSMDLLSQAIEAAPQALGGLGQVLLGRIYYTLPPLLGGDNIKAIELLTAAVQINPANIQALRYLAESYDQELEESKAIETLTAMLALAPDFADQQRFADELRFAAGLAYRLKDDNLKKRLDAKRLALLKKNPELLDRAGTAIGGHGGVNPLTGKN